MFDKIDKTLIPPALFGGLIAIGLIGAGAFIGSGVVNAQVGNRQVTVRGVAERNVVADLAVLTLSFKAANDDLPVAQAQIDRDLALVRAFLTRQGYPAEHITIGRLQVTDTRAREYGSTDNVVRYILSQGVTVRTASSSPGSSREGSCRKTTREGLMDALVAATVARSRGGCARSALRAGRRPRGGARRRGPGAPGRARSA